MEYDEWLRLHNDVNDRLKKLEANKDLPITNKEDIRQLGIHMKSAVADLNDNISNTDQLKDDLSKAMKGVYKFIVVVIIAIIGIPIYAMYYNAEKVEKSNNSVIDKIEKSDSLYSKKAVDYEIRLRVLESKE